MLLINQLSHNAPELKKKKSLDHKQYIIAKLLSWKRKRKETLGTLPLIPSSLTHPIRTSPLETGNKPPPKTAFPQGNEQLDTKLYLWELTEELQGFLTLAIFTFYLFIHIHSRSSCFTRPAWLRNKRRKLLPVIAHSSRQKAPRPNAMLHWEGRQLLFWPAVRKSLNACFL